MMAKITIAYCKVCEQQVSLTMTPARHLHTCGCMLVGLVVAVDSFAASSAGGDANMAA